MSKAAIQKPEDASSSPTRDNDFLLYFAGLEQYELHYIVSYISEDGSEMSIFHIFRVQLHTLPV